MSEDNGRLQGRNSRSRSECRRNPPCWSDWSGCSDIWSTASRRSKAAPSPEVFLACTVLRARQERLLIGGGAFEIGAHRGLFFVGLVLLAGPAERSLAIDLFDAEHLRLDSSGMGADRAALAELIASVCPDHKVDIRATDSLSIGPVERVRLAGEFGSFAFISVDGGHTAEHVYCDFETAEALVAPGGVVVVDDYYSARWPGRARRRDPPFPHARAAAGALRLLRPQALADDAEPPRRDVRGGRKGVSFGRRRHRTHPSRCSATPR